MSYFQIEGGTRLRGELAVHGAKNSALPILAAALIPAGKSVIHNCPRLLDVDTSIRILQRLGCAAYRQGDAVVVDASVADGTEIPDTLMREMRSSISFLGAIAARSGKARLSPPGGCELGPRPIDMHLSALRQMGMSIAVEAGLLDCAVKGRLRGCEIVLPFPSVGATENILLAASTAEGTTVVTNAAREPEVADLADYLNRCGARITGAGESVIRIDGVEKLHGAEHTVIPDRIAAVSYMAAAAITGGEVTLRGVERTHLNPVLPCFMESGCGIKTDGDALTISAPERIGRVRSIRTFTYPGFPTDAQPPVMAMLAKAHGTSMFRETIFENRYKHVGELTKLGARIQVDGRVAVVEGVERLAGAHMEAPDLRGGAALVIAALAAEGTSVISNISHIDRGYAVMEEALSSLGANIVRREATQD